MYAAWRDSFPGQKSHLWVKHEENRWKDECGLYVLGFQLQIQSDLAAGIKAPSSGSTLDIQV